MAFQRFIKRRFLWLALVGFALFGGGYAYVDLFIARPMGEGPAGPPVPREPFERPWTERRVLLLGLGDSITAGLGASSPEYSSFNRLIRNPDDEFSDMRGMCLSDVLPNLTFENYAVSGSTSFQHVTIIENRLPSYEPDVFGLVVMTTGGNDLIHSYGRRPPEEGAMYGATLEEARP